MAIHWAAIVAVVMRLVVLFLDRSKDKEKAREIVRKLISDHDNVEKRDNVKLRSIYRRLKTKAS